ncbi:MAG TPA: Ig-like domain-containing protein [Longimicrobium sp.]|nr:Ig-like domain-containing protein [Longimicrobium sp.]
MLKRTLPALLFAALGLAACKDSTGSGPRLSSLVVEPSTYYLGVGDTVRLSAVGTREDNDQDVAASARYSSSNTAVATVTNDGKVTAVSVGTAQITASAGGQTATATINVLAAGNFRTFNVESTSATGCDAPQYHPARLVASTAHVLVYEDMQNPAGGFTDAEYQAIANEFEAVGYQTDVTNFGQPSDLDGNGKVIALFTRAVNELTPAGVDYVYGGFFYSRDLFRRTPQPGFEACPTSNVAEMFYLLAPDPGGTINGHTRSKSYVRENTLSTLPHELQHLINSSRRFFVNNVSADETIWLDEGLSHVAEELAYYAKSGYAPRQNLGAPQVFATQAQFNNYVDYQDNNLGRLRTYLRDPEGNSPIANNDELETRGATWWLLRYLADRKGGSEQAFWFALANSNTAGFANLQNALGTDPLPWARDWAVMSYTDDTGLPVAAQFTEPSWNHRSIYGSPNAGSQFPLKVQSLTNGSTGVSVMSTSAAYFKLGVAPAATADVRFVQAGSTPVAACTPTTLAVGHVQQVVMNAGVGFCLAGGATGAEYVAIPFYGSSTSGSSITLTVTASGVVPPLGPPNPVRAPAASVLFPLDGFDPQTMRGGGRELELRLRERRIAARLRTGGTPARRGDLAAIEGPAGVTINVVRTR